jgi:hypothetical protein
MTKDQLFDFAGFTTNPDGVRKFRVGRGDVAGREAHLARQGHTDIQLTQLSKPLTREQAKAEFGVTATGITITGTEVISQFDVDLTDAATVDN